MTDKSKAQKKAEDKPAAHPDEHDVVQEGREETEKEQGKKALPNRMDDHVLRSITTADLNPAYQVEVD